MGTVAVPVGFGCGEGNQVVRGQAGRIIRIGRVGVYYGAQLVKGDVTVGGDADGEHQFVSRGRAAFHHAAIERQIHCLTGSGVGQPGSPRYHAQGIGQRTGAIGAERRGEVGGEALRGVGCQHGFVDCQRRFRAGGADARAVVLEDHLRTNFGGRSRGLEQLEATDIEIGVVIALGVGGRAVLDEHAIVVCRCGVFNLVAGFNAGDGCNPGSKADDNGRIIRRSVRVLDHQPGADVDDADITDCNRCITHIAVDEIHARFSRGAECADFYHRALTTLQLHDVESGRPRIEHGGEVDVGFNIGFVLIQVGNGHILPGTGDERKADAFLFRNHLIVGAEGGRATRLAGIDRVASRYIGAARLVSGVLAGGDNCRVRDPQDPTYVDNGRVRRREHQEQVLPGRRIGQAEYQVLASTDEHLVQQVEGIVRVAGVRMLERLVFHGPDLAAGGR
uniref:Uncharacterized protein n=1 Tax=Pseudomonas fluorescens TaxID=294 RepID=A0A5E6XA64_PSEFL|nr:hypothetical protein PS652_05216 [Pseudomonas fluorescens]